MSQNQKNGTDDTPLDKGATNDSGHEGYDEMLKELIALKAKVEMFEAWKISLLEKKMQEDEFGAEQKFRSFEEKYLNEIAELKVKNQQLTEETFKEKLEEMAQMKKIGEIENETVLLPREMKVQLPLENWHDLLAFVPRPQLGNVASEIGHYQFACIIQSFLHDERKEITLDKMSIIGPRPNFLDEQPMVLAGRNDAAMNMEDYPMPGNVKDFKEICLRYMFPMVPRHSLKSANGVVP